MKQIRDALVIGSGIIGSATAFALTRLGIRRVTLLEKGPLVSGMTRRSAGLAHPFQPHPLLCALASSSYDFYGQWAMQLAGKNPFVETGAAAIAAVQPGEPASAAQFEMWRANVGSANPLAPGALAAIFPGVAADLNPALFSPRAGYADAVLTAQALANAAVERGMEIKTGTQVKQIVVEGGQVKGVKTTTGEIEAPTVIVAAGSWSERLLAPFGVMLHLRYRRGTLVFYEQPRELTQELPMLLDASGQYFLRPHPYHMAAGGSVEANPHTQGVETLDENVSSNEQRGVNWFVERCVADMRNTPPKRAHSIIYDTPADGLAALGPVPNVRGLFVGAGFGTSAFAVAPAVGETLAQMIIDGNTGLDVSPLSPVRASLRSM